MSPQKFNEHVETSAVVSSAGAAFQIGPITKGPLPFWDLISHKSRLSQAIFADVCPVNAPDEHHTVCLSYSEKDGEPHLAMWCSDKFLEHSRLDFAEASSRAAQAAQDLPDEDSIQSMMMQHHASMPMSAPCDFWKIWRKTKTPCEHIYALLAKLREEEPNFVAEMTAAYLAMTTSATPEDPSDSELGLAFFAFKVPVLIEGERGVGKTVEARGYARAGQFPTIQKGCHEGTDSMELLGHLVPYSREQMVWKDGVLSEAFRKARTTKVVLLLDELLRVRQRELSILLTALSPDEGFYRLRTGRMLDVVDGVGVEEELVCPTENLCLVATTNVGSEYAVDTMDPALAERFVIMRKNEKQEKVQGIIEEEVNKRGFKSSVAAKCMALYLSTREASQAGLLHYSLSTRIICRIIQLAQNEKMLPQVARAMTLLLVARTSEGAPVQAESDAFAMIVDRVFK